MLRNFILFLLLMAIIGILTVVSLFFYYSRGLPSMEAVREGAVIVAESTKIYDRTGKRLLYTIHGEENRTKISLDQIPDHVKWATISTEDQNFYTRGWAIDFKGLARAVLAVMRNRDLSGPGGSTITQQLVRNFILTREKTIARKIKEIVLAFRIEKDFSRDEILELYLNQIPYGSNAYGIEQASRTFFDKPAEQLTISEAALLAVLPKATTFLSPFGNNTDELMRRHKVVLRQMLNEGYITEDEWKEAREVELKFTSGIINMKAPHFVIYVKEMLAKRYGEVELQQGGLKVITTLDYDMQQIAETAVGEGAITNDEKGADNAALVAINPRNGQMLAMVGSRDYFDTEHSGNFNVATALRQPGSSFKPFVYATLFTKGYTPNSQLLDVATDFAPRDDEEYRPVNFDGKEHGSVTVRKALAGSMNIPAVKALYLANILKVLDYAMKLGYSTLDDPDRVGLSLALGGGDVKLLEHVAAYGVLANEGLRHETAVILKVTNPDGEVLDEFKEEDGLQVFPRDVALMVTDILSDKDARAEVFGYNTPLNLGSIPAAAKTGTTNEYRDAWTIGYTPSLVAGVWVGNNDNTPMNPGMGGSRLAGPIWNKFMTEVLKDKEIENFPEVNIPETGKPILDGTMEYVKKVRIDKATGKLATEYTPEEYVEEVNFADYHSILHYIDKDNPRGPDPVDAASDPQYGEWEKAIKLWMEKKIAEEAGDDTESRIEAPPTEYDNVHIPENNPVITISSPQSGEIITADSWLVKLEAEAPRGVTTVEYYVDDMFRESASFKPFSRRIYFGSQVADGDHIITIKAYDDVGNNTTKNLTIKMDRGIESSVEPAPPLVGDPVAVIVSLANNAVVAVDQFPLVIQISLTNKSMVRQLNLYYNDKNGNPMLISSKSRDFKDANDFSWSMKPPSGTYSLYVILIDNDGDSARSEIKVTVR